MGKSRNKRKTVFRLSSMTDLRQKAEAWLSTSAPLNSPLTSQLSEAEAQKLIYELQVHQLELEMQNQELRLANERAAIAAEQYKGLFDFAPSGYFSLSAEGNIIEINLCGANMLGKERVYLINSRFGFYVSRETKPIFNRFLDQVFKTKAHESCDVALSNNGILLTHVHLIGIADRNANRCMVIAVDITERKQTADALLESQRSYSEVFESMSNAIFIQDLSTGSILDVNAAGLKMFGFDNREDAIKYSIEDISATEEGYNEEKIQRENKKAFDSNLNSFEWRSKKKNREVFWTEIKLHKTQIGGVDRLMAIVQDINARKRAEDALQSSNDRLEEAQKIARIGHWEANLITGELYWSQVIFDIFGFDPKVFKPSVKAFHEAVYPEDSEKVLESEKRSELSGLHDVVHRIVRPDKEVRYVHELARRYKDSNGKLIMLRGTVQDITDLKLAEAEIKLKNSELLKLNNEKDKFFSIIAHDLQSPFTALLGFTQMLDEELPTLKVEEIQVLARSMRTSSNNLYRLLGNLLEWSRMQMGAISFSPRLFLLKPKVEDCLRLVMESANKKEVVIGYDIDEDISVFADENMLSSTIRNLATNALKFTPRGGEVIISAKKREDNSVEISVLDTGIGMGKDLLDKLFVVGDQISRRGTGGETGSGLGLIICRDFIEKHGGRIWVKSEVGKGSTFSFNIPGN